jgi:hypothetical protein
VNPETLERQRPTHRQCPLLKVQTLRSNSWQRNRERVIMLYDEARPNGRKA